MKHNVCIHGHFYQPPRENAWLEEIEIQESAYPYHDWNERVTAECYAPNTASRILDSKKKIVDIVNNYPKMSFDFGPTLLSWMERHAPGIYQAILVSDRLSQERFSGHGSAIAQAYNHMIMPLANSRDKITQVIWGIRDFHYRFGRDPKGMWLPETAVDLETLDILAEHKIQFTILAPHQAKRVRELGDEQWSDASGEKIDPKYPYLCRLPSGRSIVLFFYDGPVSQDVAFRGLLGNGQAFAERLVGIFPENSHEELLEHIATDGETYGHHHRFGDMALAYCFHYLEKNKLARIMIYSEYLEYHPPEKEVEIIEQTSWSCAHGVERWRFNCGCSIGRTPGWTQAWRAPLRQALDLVRDALIPIYEDRMKQFSPDPWKARDHYIEVILDRSVANVERFLADFCRPGLAAEEKIQCLKLLEMQRQAMLMYTSCGWFFDDISGVEAVQVMQYAARAIQLARDLAGIELEGKFKKILQKATSNVKGLKDGALIYDFYIRPKVIGLMDVGAHYAMSSIFEDYPDSVKLFCYEVSRQDYEKRQKDDERLILGRATLRSQVTWEEIRFSFAVIYAQEHNYRGSLKLDMDEQHYERMKQDLLEAFGKGETAKVLEEMTDHFGKEIYSFWNLFPNQQEKALSHILKPALENIRFLFHSIFDHQSPLLASQESLRIALPRTLAMTVEFAVNRDLRELLLYPNINLEELQRLVDEVKSWSFQLDDASLSFAATKKINDLMQQLAKEPLNKELLSTIETVFKTLKILHLPLERWRAQNIYFSIGKEHLKMMQERAAKQDDEAKAWLEHFNNLGTYLEI